MDSTTIIDQGFALLMGLSLAAVCGLRAFLPLWLIGVLAATGKIELAEGYAWLGRWPAITTFSVAVLVELLADKLPVVDHVLDAAGLVIKPAAAALTMASMITAFDPLVSLVLALLTGGLIAEILHLLKAKLRLLSTMLTGTLAGPLLSFLEDLSAAFLSLVAYLAPLLATLGIAALIVVLLLRRKVKQA